MYIHEFFLSFWIFKHVCYFTLLYSRISLCLNIFILIGWKCLKLSFALVVRHVNPTWRTPSYRLFLFASEKYFPSTLKVNLKSSKKYFICFESNINIVSNTICFSNLILGDLVNHSLLFPRINYLQNTNYFFCTVRYIKPYRNPVYKCIGSRQGFKKCDI